MVIVTRYRPGGEWQPRELSAGAAVLAMLEHTVPAQARPEQTLRVLRKAIDGAVVLEGERGEADQLARRPARDPPRRRLTQQSRAAASAARHHGGAHVRTARCPINGRSVVSELSKIAVRSRT